MKSSIKKDPVPVVQTGPRTIRCTECNFEVTLVVPEEVDMMLSSILEHIQQHGIQIPQFLVTIY